MSAPPPVCARLKFTFTGVVVIWLLLVPAAVKLKIEVFTTISTACVFSTKVVLLRTVNNNLTVPGVVPTKVLLNEPIDTGAYTLAPSRVAPFLISALPEVTAYFIS